MWTTSPLIRPWNHLKRFVWAAFVGILYTSYQNLNITWGIAQSGGGRQKNNHRKYSKLAYPVLTWTMNHTPQLKANSFFTKLISCIYRDHTMYNLRAVALMTSTHLYSRSHTTVLWNLTLGVLVEPLVQHKSPPQGASWTNLDSRPLINPINKH